VDTVDFARRRYRCEVDDAGREQHRQLCIAHGAREDAQSADAAVVVARGEIREAEIAFVRMLDGCERQTIAGRAGDELRARVAEDRDEGRNVGQCLRGGQGSVEEHRAVMEPAQIDGYGTGIDAERAGHVVRDPASVALGRETFGELGDGLRVEDGVVALEQARDAPLWTFILNPPTPIAPNAVTPSRSLASSPVSMPSMPNGGTALRSHATWSPRRLTHASRGTSSTPAGPALRRMSGCSASSTCAASDALRMHAMATSPPNRVWMFDRARSPSSSRRDVIVTCAPALASKPAARSPTGPVPAVTSTFRSRTSRTARVIFTTAATAVVLDPFESSIIETRKGPNTAFCAAERSFSPMDMSLPPMNTAVLRRSFGPRVKMQP